MHPDRHIFTLGTCRHAQKHQALTSVIITYHQFNSVGPAHVLGLVLSRKLNVIFVQVQPFQQLDLADRRRKKELQEICEVAANKGIKADVSCGACMYTPAHAETCMLSLNVKDAISSTACGLIDYLQQYNMVPVHPTYC